MLGTAEEVLACEDDLFVGMQAMFKDGVCCSSIPCDDFGATVWFARQMPAARQLCSTDNSLLRCCRHKVWHQALWFSPVTPGSEL